MEQINHYNPKEEELMRNLNRLLEYKRAKHEKIIICKDAQDLLDKISQNYSKQFLFIPNSTHKPPRQNMYKFDLAEYRRLNFKFRNKIW